jgi:hypothetical protein
MDLGDRQSYRQDADALVYTLFGLEGFSIAERLGIPSAAFSPFLLDRNPPAGFEEVCSQSLSVACFACRVHPPNHPRC